MITLAIDTALQSCAAAIVADGKSLSVQQMPLHKGHAEHIAPMVQAALDEAGVTAKQLDRIGVVVGPGGFTGVRVGLAFARSLALGTGARVLGINSLRALALMVKTECMIAPVLDARRAQVYAGLFDKVGVEILPPFVATPEACARRLADEVGEEVLILTGSGAALLELRERDCVIGDGDGQIDPLTLARFCEAATPTAHPPSPVYLRPPDAKISGPSLFDHLQPS